MIPTEINGIILTDDCIESIKNKIRLLFPRKKIMPFLAIKSPPKNKKPSYTGI